MSKIIPAKLQKGDEVRIIAPSRGSKIIGEEVKNLAAERLHALGLQVSYATNTIDENWDILGTTSIQKRVDDIHEAFADPHVKGIFTMIGGFNSNQLLPYIDYQLIKNNPKIFCGFSDITTLLNAFYAKSGLVTFLGPHFSSLGMLKGLDYTISNLQKMLFTVAENATHASLEWSDDLWFQNQETREFIKNEGYWNINSGSAEGTILGGNLGTFNLLLGSEYRPAFERNTILFVEDTGGSDIAGFMRNLTALTYQPDFHNVKGLVIGRFQKGSKISRNQLEYVIKSLPDLAKLAILGNVDFGHTTPLLTIPIGGRAKIHEQNLLISHKKI